MRAFNMAKTEQTNGIIIEPSCHRFLDSLPGVFVHVVVEHPLPGIPKFYFGKIGCEKCWFVDFSKRFQSPKMTVFYILVWHWASTEWSC